MKPCIFRSKGRCELAEYLCQSPTQIHVTEGDCDNCQSQGKADWKSPTPIVKELAVSAATEYLPALGEKIKRSLGLQVAALPPAMSKVHTSSFPCRHRSTPIREYKCKPCKGARVHDVCNCLLLNRECTERAASDCRDSRDGKLVETCMLCDHREPGFIPIPQDRFRYVSGPRGELVPQFANMYGGRAAFLVCGGPSTKRMDLSPLSERGILTAAVNNAGAAVSRPNVWFCWDNPRKFHPSIFADPTCMAFVPKGHAKTPARESTPDGFRDLGEMRTFPNVWFYSAMSPNNWNPKRFLLEPSVMAGKKVAVMYPAIRILHDLGIRRIYLLGCDFHMDPKECYAWDQKKTAGACRSNNNLYRSMNECFTEARPHWEEAGLHVYNCTPGSQLEAFERMEFADAIDREKSLLPACDDLSRYYTSKDPLQG